MSTKPDPVILAQDKHLVTVSLWRCPKGGTLNRTTTHASDGPIRGKCGRCHLVFWLDQTQSESPMPGIRQFLYRRGRTHARP